MKYFLSSFFVLVNVCLFGQKPQHFVAISFSNDGQLAPISNTFYFRPDAYNPGDDVSSFDQFNFKFNAHYDFLLLNKFLFNSRFGFSFRSENYKASNLPNTTGTENQQFYQIGIGLSRSFEVGRFLISTGGELPFHVFSDYNASIIQNDPSNISNTKISTNGGYALGINSISSFKFFIGRRLYLKTSITFGFLYFNLGNRTSVNTEYITPSLPSTSDEYENTFRGLRFTAPELLFGLGLKIN